MDPGSKTSASYVGLAVCLVLLISPMFHFVEWDPAGPNYEFLFSKLVVPLIGALGVVACGARLLLVRRRYEAGSAAQFQPPIPVELVERTGWPSVSCLTLDSPIQHSVLSDAKEDLHCRTKISRVLWAVVWCAAFSVAGCVLNGLLEALGNAWSISSSLIVLAATMLAAAGSAMGMLPGTRRRRSRNHQQELAKTS